MEQNEISLLVAIYGAVLSTIALSWNIIRSARDRAKISVTAQIEKRWVVSGSEYDVIKIELSNTGKRPITVTNIFFKAGKQITVMSNSYLPKELSEGQYFSVDIPIVGIDKEKTEYFIAKDIKGNEYRTRKYPLRGK